MPKRQMLINYVPGEECRIAIVEDGKLEEFYQERTSNESHVNNIYKGKVCNVEPSIQAAFIEFGLERNGFLHISDLHPKYFPGDAKEETEQVGLKTPRRDRPPIQKCLRRGQEILVQVLKEGIGTKGPTLTSYLSIPGRYLVMMPDMERLGVSRKIDDDEARRVSRDILNELNPPKGFGFIIRTAGIGRTKADLKRDLAYLQRLWKNIDRRMKEVRIGELFAESDLVIRTIRDIYSTDIERIIVDDETAARRARDFLLISNPRSGSNVLVYRDKVPLFNRFDVERQIETINAKIVPLESGGSLVIESTEALVAIDVNSGKYRDNRDAEMTAYKTNVEATDEICRQLRLRDLGGVVVNDLIDMRSPTHRRDIEHRFRENLKKDRARTRTLPISQFGILEMTRQRMRPSLKKSIYTDCPSCGGAGLVKSPESVVLDVMRRLSLAMHRQQVARIELTVSPDVAFQLLNKRRSHLVAIEQAYGKPVTVRVNGAAGIDFVALAGFDGRGGAVEAEIVEKMGEPTLEPVESLGGMEEEILDDEEVLEGAGGDAAGAPSGAADGDDDGSAARDRAAAEDQSPDTFDRAEPERTAPEDQPAQYGATDRDGLERDDVRGEDARSEAAEPIAPGPHRTQGVPRVPALPGVPAAPAVPGVPGAAGTPGASGSGEAAEGGRRRRRRRRRGRRGRGKGQADGQPQTSGAGSSDADAGVSNDIAPRAEGSDGADDSGDDTSPDAPPAPLPSHAYNDDEGPEPGNQKPMLDDDDGSSDSDDDTTGSPTAGPAPDAPGGSGAAGGTGGSPTGDQPPGKRRRRRRGGRGRRGRGRRGGGGEGGQGNSQPSAGHGQSAGGGNSGNTPGGPEDVSRGYRNTGRGGDPNGNVAPPPPPGFFEPPSPDAE